MVCSASFLLKYCTEYSAVQNAVCGQSRWISMGLNLWSLTHSIFKQRNLFTKPSWHIYMKYFQIFGTPWDPPYNQKEEKWKFHIWSVWYQNRVKRVIGVYFWRNFWKIFKSEDFGFEFLEKCQILVPFSGLAPSKLNIYKNILRVGNERSEIFWYK